MPAAVTFSDEVSIIPPNRTVKTLMDKLSKSQQDDVVDVMFDEGFPIGEKCDWGKKTDPQVLRCLEDAIETVLSWEDSESDEGDDWFHPDTMSRIAELRRRCVGEDGGPCVDATDSDARTYLHYAAMHGRVEGAQYLLDRGATVDLPDIHKRTALHIAALGGHAAVAGVLVLHGADPRLTDRFGNTPLQCAKSAGHAPAIGQAILEAQYGSDPFMTKGKEEGGGRKRKSCHVAGVTSSAERRGAGPTGHNFGRA